MKIRGDCFGPRYFSEGAQNKDRKMDGAKLLLSLRVVLQSGYIFAEDPNVINKKT